MLSSKCKSPFHLNAIHNISMCSHSESHLKTHFVLLKKWSLLRELQALFLTSQVASPLIEILFVPAQNHHICLYIL